MTGKTSKIRRTQAQLLMDIGKLTQEDFDALESEGMLTGRTPKGRRSDWSETRKEIYNTLEKIIEENEIILKEEGIKLTICAHKVK